MDRDTVPRRGRPPKNANQGNFTFRTPAGLRENLAAAASLSGRSVSEEITHRLSRTFEAEDIVASTLGGPNSATLMRGILQVIQQSESETGANHRTDDRTARLLVMNVRAFLDVYFAHDGRKITEGYTALAALGSAGKGAESRTEGVSSLMVERVAKALGISSSTVDREVVDMFDSGELSTENMAEKIGEVLKRRMISGGG